VTVHESINKLGYQFGSPANSNKFIVPRLNLNLNSHWLVQAFGGQLLHEVVQVTAWGVFQNHVQAGLIVEVAVHANYVRVTIQIYILEDIWF
jgi:hypothetical protein